VTKSVETAVELPVVGDRDQVEELLEVTSASDVQLVLALRHRSVDAELGEHLSDGNEKFVVGVKNERLPVGRDVPFVVEQRTDEHWHQVLGDPRATLLVDGVEDTCRHAGQRRRERDLVASPVVVLSALALRDVWVDVEQSADVPPETVDESSVGVVVPDIDGVFVPVSVDRAVTEKVRDEPGQFGRPVERERVLEGRVVVLSMQPVRPNVDLTEYPHRHVGLPPLAAADLRVVRPGPVCKGVL
jgi:hypothetical protein